MRQAYSDSVSSIYFLCAFVMCVYNLVQYFLDKWMGFGISSHYPLKEDVHQSRVTFLDWQAVYFGRTKQAFQLLSNITLRLVHGAQGFGCHESAWLKCIRTYWQRVKVLFVNIDDLIVWFICYMVQRPWFVNVFNWKIRKISVGLVFHIFIV